MPKHIIESQNDQGLVILIVEHSNSYHVSLHLTLPRAEKTGRAAKYFYRLLLASINER